ncbi:MAG: response regulator transcription factor [Polaromonas sp.]|nr:response regulator transcription factor [Polaromonas sp.]
MSSGTITALIAEDEPLLAAALKTELARAWPELQVVAIAGDGVSAVAQALKLQPDVLFFDIQMPGMNGLDAATELADSWGLHGAQAKPFPALVFVTAFDQYAVHAFEAQAVDYLLKPVQAERLQKTVSKLRSAHINRVRAAINSGADLQVGMERALGQLRELQAMLNEKSHHASGMAPPAPLQIIQASLAGSQGNSIRMVPIADVLYFEAADKYLRVVTMGAEYLIRTPLKELLPQLPAHTFWQIHRGTIVRASAISAVARDDSGRLSITLQGSADTISVSRLYAHLFKAM